jgi:hypothetical protein
MTAIMTTPTYVKQLNNGQFEYGQIKINATNRRKDQMIRLGIAHDYESACRELYAIIERTE